MAIKDSFWGEPTYEPGDEEIARHLELIREQTKDLPDDRALRTATSAMHAIQAFIIDIADKREALAILDKLRREVIGQA